jgi:hypothetical protein
MFCVAHARVGVLFEGLEGVWHVVRVPRSLCVCVQSFRLSLTLLLPPADELMGTPGLSTRSGAVYASMTWHVARGGRSRSMYGAPGWVQSNSPNLCMRAWRCRAVLTYTVRRVNQKHAVNACKCQATVFLLLFAPSESVSREKSAFWW